MRWFLEGFWESRNVRNGSGRRCRRAILDAARDLFVAEGYHNVSIRKIAERIEYSPAAIYSYFPSKDDIFFALAEEGFRLLFARGPRRHADDADRSDCASAQAFWRVYEFSKTHPEYFALMFLDRTVPRISQDWERFEFVRDDARRSSAPASSARSTPGIFPPGTHPARGLPHPRRGDPRRRGRAAVRRLAPGEDSDALARDTLEAALTGLRTGFPTTFVPHARAMTSSEHDSE